ncbi:hypothetical protein CLI64_19260 [Nostoc sp. CENA543]|nr:hypothetical protein CLI64_19260 [Nostoc sp. CENA543]
MKRQGGGGQKVEGRGQGTGKMGECGECGGKDFFPILPPLPHFLLALFPIPHSLFSKRMSCGGE